MKKSKSVKKKKIKTKIFTKKPKELTIKQLSDVLAFPPKKSKKPKRLTKYQMLTNILPFHETTGISRKQYAFKRYAETYNVEVMDSKSLDDSLFLAKRSLDDFFRELLEEKRGFKYILSTRITFTKWNNATNAYDFDTIYRNSDLITVTNKRFNLATAYQTLKHRVEFYSNEGSGWIIDKIEDIWINISNYEPLSGSSYIPLAPELDHPMKGLIKIKNKDNNCFKWCRIRFHNPTNSHPEKINKQDKKSLDYRGINFLMKTREYEIVEERFNINVNVFGYENEFFLYMHQKNLMNKN